MLLFTLVDKGLGSTRIVRIGRPELSPATFNEVFSPSNHTLCLPRPSGEQNTGFDGRRDMSLPTVLGRKAAIVTTTITHHNADIKRRVVLEGSGVWAEYMTRQAYEYFRDIRGPERLLV